MMIQSNTELPAQNMRCTPEGDAAIEAGVQTCMIRHQVD